MLNQNDVSISVKERFAQLPKVVQDAITSADVEKQMRKLADTHKLHIDQWQSLENEVMLALLGFQSAADLEKNIKSEVGVSEEVAKQLAADISKIVFEPIRQELERQLEHPDAKAAAESGVEAARTQVLANVSSVPAAPVTSAPPAAPVVAPATPPPAPPTQRIERAPISAAYKAGEPSSIRPSVEDDPYRESPA